MEGMCGVRCRQPVVSELCLRPVHQLLSACCCCHAGAKRRSLATVAPPRIRGAVADEFAAAHRIRNRQYSSPPAGSTSGGASPRISGSRSCSRRRIVVPGPIGPVRKASIRKCQAQTYRLRLFRLLDTAIASLSTCKVRLPAPHACPRRRGWRWFVPECLSASLLRDLPRLHE
jgi:hypothetical protein